MLPACIDCTGTGAFIRSVSSEFILFSSEVLLCESAFLLTCSRSAGLAVACCLDLPSSGLSRGITGLLDCLALSVLVTPFTRLGLGGGGDPPPPID